MADFGIGTRFSLAGCSGRMGREEGWLRREGKGKARVVLKGWKVFMFACCLIGSFPPSALLSLLPSTHGIRD